LLLILKRVTNTLDRCRQQIYFEQERMNAPTHPDINIRSTKMLATKQLLDLVQILAILVRNTRHLLPEDVQRLTVDHHVLLICILRLPED